MLPGPGLVLLVIPEALDLGRHRPGASGRPKPHVDRIERAVIGRRGERADEALGQPGEILHSGERPPTAGFGTSLVEIVDQDQVEVGSRGHLPAAELAHGQHRGLLPREPAVRRRKGLLHRPMQRRDQHIGQARERLPGLLGGNRARQDAGADQHHLLLPEHARAVEKILIGARLLEAAAELRGEFLRIRQSTEECRIHEAVHGLWILRDHIGKPRRGAQREDQQRQEIRIA